jgi:hypothetical protein
MDRREDKELDMRYTMVRFSTSIAVPLAILSAWFSLGSSWSFVDQPNSGIRPRRKLYSLQRDHPPRPSFSQQVSTFDKAKGRIIADVHHSTRINTALASASHDDDGDGDDDGDNNESSTENSKAATYSEPSKLTSTPVLPKIIVTCTTMDELVEAIDEYVKPHHVVAEIGSQLRDASTKICQNCRQATLVDIQRKFPKARLDTHRTEAMRLPRNEDDDAFFPDKSNFYEIRQLSDWPQAFFMNHQNGDNQNVGYYDILVLDVNAIVGNDLEWTSLQIIQQFHSWNAVWRPNNGGDELIVLVKSSGLNQWANRIHHPKYWKDHQEELWNSMNTPPFIVATTGVQEYRSTIPGTVRPTDFVLEVGCHFGTTTTLLHEQAAHCMGVDVGSKIIAQAQRRYPHIDFRVGNAWNTGELLRFLQDYKRTHELKQDNTGFDVIYVDVGGLSGSDGLSEAIQLISSLRYALEPRCIVIKSLCMQRLSSKLVCFWQLKKRKQKSERAVEPDE